MKEAIVLYLLKGEYHFEQRTIMSTFDETDPAILGLPDGSEVILIIGSLRGANFWLQGKLKEFF